MHRREKPRHTHGWPPGFTRYAQGSPQLVWVVTMHGREAQACPGGPLVGPGMRRGLAGPAEHRQACPRFPPGCMSRDHARPREAQACSGGPQASPGIAKQIALGV